MKKRLSYSYGCVMGRLPEPLASGVRDIAARIPDEYIYQDDKGESGREDEPHVTVKYGLHTDDPQEVADVIGYYGPVSGELRGMSAFVNDNVVLKMGVQSRELQRLNRLICQELEYTDTYPEYRPHVTVAYLKKGPADNPYYFKNFYTDELEGEVFEIDKVEFSTPSGKRYWISLIDGAITKKESGMNKAARELLNVARILERESRSIEDIPPDELLEYFELNHAAHKLGEPGYAKGGTQIWYMKPSFFRKAGGLGYKWMEKQDILPDPKRLKRTHEYLGSIKEKNLNKIFKMMQGEEWSPRGEARSLIRSKGLGHTSMSVGDIIKIGSKVLMVDMFGFKEL